MFASPRAQKAAAGAAAADAEEARGSRVRKEAEPARGGGGEAAPAAEALARKIIYNSGIEIVADDLAKADEQLRQLVKSEKGYIANSELLGVTGSQRQARWTIRIPVDRFDSFREAILKLGEVKRDSIDSQDVTDQFYDLEARIKNNKAEEESLRKLLEQAKDHTQMLALRQELNRVRSELDVQQGQLKRLDQLSALATFNVTIHERRGYVPPETPAFGTRLERTFGDSLTALRSFGEGAVIVVVAVAPWLGVVALAIAPFWVLRRRRSAVEASVIEQKTATAEG
jgi:hypothetical protein